VKHSESVDSVEGNVEEPLDRRPRGQLHLAAAVGGVNEFATVDG